MTHDSNSADLSQASTSSVPSELRRLPPPPYRHATPSAPWPWMDIHDPINKEHLKSGASPVPVDCDHETCDGRCWKDYPQSRFPNWTKGQVEKCKIQDVIMKYDRSLQCSIYLLDVNKHGTFKNAGKLEMEDGEATILNGEWNWFKDHKQRPDVRVRALFVENLSGPALRMLGAKYNIEPFFFSSSLNWIPSRFQEDSREGIGDHITITLPFIQVVPGELVPHIDSPSSLEGFEDVRSTGHHHLVTERIDTRAPLRTRVKGGKGPRESALALDLLSVHLVRNVKGNTIISYHANMDLPTTKAHYMHERILFAGQSVYWEKMLERAQDPTLLLLIFIWQAAYAWDEALQNLKEYICELETEVIRTSSLDLTQRLHTIGAHHLSYSSLLKSFKKAVQFIRETPNPSLTEDQREVCDPLMERECNALLEEVDRLHTECKMQGERLENITNLVFSSVRIYDSKIMKTMTEAALRDSEGMKQISYLTTVFLPGYFLTYIFSMNVTPLNPFPGHPELPIYLEITIPLTVATIWIVMAFQSKYMFPKDTPIWKYLCWPIFLPRHLYTTHRQG
ncbi:hypothetical protein M378DRAFT_172312 [Amanita muscaria Koide BX008]|uniref:Uncharacterized protein n=1 Tax=Amanita muscaria (strain Koide BX008) TaxID=946122 RepID=A0A0C2WL47_AMAMK|nr:hypothetical protein M378DRAFT_172312 [Amanita muscaria Koide BX008]